MARGPLWKPHDDARLATMLEMGKNYEECAKAMGRTWGGIQKRAVRLGIYVKPKGRPRRSQKPRDLKPAPEPAPAVERRPVEHRPSRTREEVASEIGEIRQDIVMDVIKRAKTELESGNSLHAGALVASLLKDNSLNIRNMVALAKEMGRQESQETVNRLQKHREVVDRYLDYRDAKMEAEMNGAA